MPRTSRPDWNPFPPQGEEALKNQSSNKILSDDEKTHRKVHTDGSLPTLRDDNGNVVLYENPDDPTKNLIAYKQAIIFSVAEPVYDYEEAKKAFDFEITEFKPRTDRELITEFFSLYEQLKTSIPVFGEEVSHEFLIKESSNIAGEGIVDTKQYLVVSSSLNLTRNQLIEGTALFQSVLGNAQIIDLENDSLRSQIQTLSSSSIQLPVKTALLPVDFWNKFNRIFGNP